MRLQISLVLGCVVILSATAQAQSDRWVKEGTESDSSSLGTIYFDRVGIVIDGVKRTTWVKTVYQTNQYEVTSNVFYTEKWANYTFDCKQRKMAANAFYLKDANGEIVRSVDIKDIEWDAVLPESVGEGKWLAVCKYKVP